MLSWFREGMLAHFSYNDNKQYITMVKMLTQMKDLNLGLHITYYYIFIRLTCNISVQND